MIRKTAVITAASIAGVVLAGGVAVGANIGILNAADDGSLGELSAEAPITSAALEPVASLEPDAKVATSKDNSQSFTVDVAGEVEVDVGVSALHLGDVRANQGWSWQEKPTTDGSVVVTFSSGDDQLIFTATLNGDGTINARIDRPVVTGTAPSVPATNGSSPSYVDDDSYEQDDHTDDHGDDYEDHELEYEGRDEDD